MKGSEKQIKWAEDIVKNIEDIINDMVDANSDRPEIEQFKAVHQNILTNIKKESAENIINDFKEIQINIIDGEKQVKENYERFANQVVVVKKLDGRDYMA